MSLEEFSAVIAAIHAAATTPERWPEAHAAITRLVKSSKAAALVLGEGLEKLRVLDARGQVRLHPRNAASMKRLMELLAPHVETAKHVQTLLAQAQPGRLALAGLDCFTAAAFILDSARAVCHLNASARTLLTRNRHIQITNTRLWFTQPTVNAAFEAALHSAMQRDPVSGLFPLRGAGKEMAEASVSPLVLDRESFLSGRMLALLVISHARLDAEALARRVRGLYGLTEAEGRVMAALAIGETVDAIALAHGVCTSTVRAQVRSLFDKTGVSRQSDLVRLALVGAPLVARADY